MVFVSRETLKKTVKKALLFHVKHCIFIHLYVYLFRLKACDFVVYKHTNCTQIYKYTSIQIQLYTCIRALLYTSIQVFVYTCICVYLYTVSTQYKRLLLTVSTRERWMLTNKSYPHSYSHVDKVINNMWKTNKICGKLYFCTLLNYYQFCLYTQKKHIFVPLFFMVYTQKKFVKNLSMLCVEHKKIKNFLCKYTKLKNTN